MSSVLDLNQKTLRFMGYMRPHLLRWFPSLIPNILFAIFPVILAYGNIAYILANSDDMNKATGAVYVLTGMTVCFSSHVDVACKKRSVERFFVDFVALVDERKTMTTAN